MMKPALLIIFISQTITIGICIVIAMYWLVKYIMIYSKKECCKDRHSYIIDITALVVCITSILWDILDFNSTKSNIIVIILFILNQILSLCVIIFIGKYVQHIYHIYYNIQFSKELNESEWINIITNNSTEYWYIKNKNKWGNKYYTNKVSLIYIIAQYIPLLILFAVDSFVIKSSVYYIVLLILTAPMFMPIIFILILYPKIRKFDDMFLIIKQFKYNGLILLICLSFWLGFIIVKLFSHHDSYSYYIGAFGVSFSIEFFACLFVFINTYWVINYVVFNRGYSMSLKKAVSGRRIKLHNIFANSDALTVFVKHLTYEFSVELLLSLIEFNQYKQYVINKLNIKSDTANISDIIEFKDVPSSYIIASYNKNKNISDDIIRIKYIGLELYNKYISQGSQYEINIPHDVRYKLRVLLDDPDMYLNRISIKNDELCNIFEESCTEMIKLLGFSLMRSLERKNIFNEFTKCLYS